MDLETIWTHPAFVFVLRTVQLDWLCINQYLTVLQIRLLNFQTAE